jgi:hypothetical protein
MDDHSFNIIPVSVRIQEIQNDKFCNPQIKNADMYLSVSLCLSVHSSVHPNITTEEQMNGLS